MSNVDSKISNIGNRHCWLFVYSTVVTEYIHNTVACVESWEMKDVAYQLCSLKTPQEGRGHYAVNLLCV